MSRRFAVILSADVVDYSILMAEDQESTISMIRDLRERSLEPVAENYGGEVLKRMGDGFLIAFPSVSDAVNAAMEAQKGLAEHPTIRLRMGMHMGDIVQDEADVYGAGLNLATRLQTEAPPGGVMISADLHRQLSGKPANEFKDAGAFKLKNIAQPVQGFQWRPDGILTGRRADEVPVIVVETFAAAPNDEETKTAAADLRDQIIYGLSRRTGIRVRNAMHDEIDEATYVLRGRLRHSGGNARANLSLVLKADGSSSWAERYEGATDDLYSFCDLVAAKADTELRLFINSLDNVRIAEIPDDKLSVSELRTRGAGLFYDCSLPSLERCISVMNRARRLSPDDGMALSMWAIAVNMLLCIRFETPAEKLLAELTAANDTAVELMPRSDFVFFTRALFRASFLHDAKKTMADAQRCYALNPNYPQAHIALGYGHLLAGAFEQAVTEFANGTQQTNDPYWSYRVFHKAVAQYCGEDYAGAVATLNDLIDLKPSVRGFRKLLILALREAGNETAAEREAAAAGAFPDEENFFLQEPPLPTSHMSLREMLAPGSGEG
jgi:class 3 adenylate cyclase/tetratricopeptide (TPR) repeat protein